MTRLYRQLYRPNDGGVRERVVPLGLIRGPQVERPTRDGSFERARALRKAFTQREAEKRPYAMGHTWPREMMLVGTCLSTAYSSDKWNTKGEFVEYKHVSESRQNMFFSRAMWQSGREFQGPRGDFGYVMPEAVAELALFEFMQARLYVGVRGDEGIFGRGSDGIRTVRVDDVALYGGYAKDPRDGSDEPFLAVASRKEGVLIVVVGEELDIEKDGITG